MTVGIPTLHIPEGAPVTVRARWTKEDGTTYTQTDISGTTITQNTYSINSSTPYVVTNTTPLTITAVIFNSLVTTADWTLDKIGYNFKVTLRDSLFNDGGGHYRVEFVLPGTSTVDNRTYRIELLVGDTYS